MAGILGQKSKTAEVKGILAQAAEQRKIKSLANSDNIEKQRLGLNVAQSKVQLKPSYEGIDLNFELKHPTLAKVLNAVGKFNQNTIGLPLKSKLFDRTVSQAANTMVMNPQQAEVVDTGSKLGNTIADIIGTGIGFAERLPGTGISYQQGLSALGKPVEKAVTKATLNSPKLVKALLPTVARTSAEMGALGAGEGIVNNESPSQIAKRAGEGALAGAVLGGASVGLTKGLPALKKSALKTETTQKKLGLNKDFKGTFKPPETVKAEKLRLENAKLQKAVEDYYNTIDYLDYLNSNNPDYIKAERNFRRKNGFTPLSKVKLGQEPPKIEPKITPIKANNVTSDLMKSKAPVYIKNTKLQEVAVTKETPKLELGKLPTEVKPVSINSDNWKDKAKLSYKLNTMERNLTDIIPNKNEAKAVIDTYITPIHVNEANSIRSLNEMRNKIKSFGIKAFSKESELAQKYGEGVITLDELKKASPKNWQKIKDVTEYMRKTYDELLNKANEVLVRNGYNPIPKRKNYMPHMGDTELLLKMLGIDNPELPTDINGLTGMFTPGKSWFRNALRRKGDKTIYDAVRGFDEYIDGVNKIIYHTDDIQRIRSLEKTLREKYAGTQHLTNLVSELHDFANLLAGKKSTLDRGAEEIVGRKIYKIADTVRKQTSANMVGANVSSALTNFIPLTQSLATTDKESFIKGMAETIANIFKDDGFINKSDFLTRRIGSDKLALSNWQKVGKAANWMFKAVDDFVSQVIVRGKYNEGIKKGLSPEQALKQADEWAAKIMADRSYGSIPTLFSSKTLAPLTQFQLEVNNQLQFLFKDLPREYMQNGVNAKAVAGLGSALAQVALYSYLFNNLFEKATGRRPAFDIIGVIEKTIENSNNPNLNQTEKNKKLLTNIANQLPFSSVWAGGRIPLDTALPDIAGIVKGEKELKPELAKSALTLLPPTGGGQIRKTITGLQTLKQGGVYNKDKTQLKYPVLPTTQNKIRGILFGVSAFPETQNYYNNAEKQLSESQTEAYNKLINKGKSPDEAYNMILKQRKIDSLKAEMSKVKNDKKLTTDEKKQKILELQNKLSQYKK